MVPSRAEWRGETDNRATPPVGYCPSTASFSVRPYCKNARRDRCQEYHNCFPLRELEETTRTTSNYVDENYPARPEIKQSLPGWGDNCGSESSTLETDVCVWRYAPLVVLATQEDISTIRLYSAIHDGCYGGKRLLLWYCWLGLLTCKNRRPCNLYCVGWDVKPCTITITSMIALCHTATVPSAADHSLWLVSDALQIRDFADFYCGFSQP